MKLSVVIPSLNEREAIPIVLRQLSSARQRLLEFAAQFEVIVVDDGSSDGSLEMLQQFEKKYSWLRVIKHRVNRGYGAAIKSGVMQASGDFIAFLDMDGTYHIPDLSIFLEKAIKCDLDMVVGNRFGENTEMDRIRKVGNVLFSGIVSILFWRNVQDCCSGLRLVRGNILREMLPSLPDHLDFALALTLKMIVSGRNFSEDPTTYKLRIGESKLSELFDGLRFIRRIAHLRFSSIVSN